MLKIGDFSKLSRISIRMLRHYDEMGLLIPQSIDDFTGYRYYAEHQLTSAQRIAELREMGFGLAVIGKILCCNNNPQILAECFAAKQAELLAEAQTASHRLLLLETAINRLRKDESAMNYNVTVKTMPQRYVASVRKIIPSYNQEGMLWKIMMTETASQKMQPAENSNSLAMFHDDGFKESDVDVEVQMTVKGSYKNTENVVFKTEPALEIASAVYNGSYEQITAVNQAVAQWVQENGYVFNDMMFCIYHVSPNDTKNPQEYVTEVCYAVKKK